MLINTGIVTGEVLEKALPPAERRAKGPYAVIECFQEIPCNPCSVSCPFDAIIDMEDINILPELIADACTGCGICAGVCPGLAIFIVDESKGEGLAEVSIPYEFLPLPEKDEIVRGVGRDGCFIREARVVRVHKGRKTRTPLVTLEVPLEDVHKIRFFTLKEEESSLEETLPLSESSGDPDEEIIICRCEGITLGEIRALIREGYTTVDEIKRINRAGMGPCQARTCGPLIAAEIARMTGTPVEEVQPSLHRPPVKPLPISFFMEDK